MSAPTPGTLDGRPAVDAFDRPITIGSEGFFFDARGKRWAVRVTALRTVTKYVSTGVNRKEVRATFEYTHLRPASSGTKSTFVTPKLQNFVLAPWS
jgi:hypothetical protein